jgi:hypothetical protein
MDLNVDSIQQSFEILLDQNINLFRDPSLKGFFLKGFFSPQRKTALNEIDYMRWTWKPLGQP